MKHKALTVLLVLIFTVGGYAQVYKPLASENNSWSIVSYSINGIAIVSDNTYSTHYKLEGDTIIQSNSYKKIFSTKDSLLLVWDVIGFIREDTTSKKVWIMDSLGNEGLVYDFDLWTGKEVTFFNPFYTDTITYEVTNIDSILIQTEYRKIYTLYYKSALYTEQWIEGIGSTKGMINSSCYKTSRSNLDYYHVLLCFSNDEIEYINPDFETCHKTSFTPFITNQNIDTAYVNLEYRYQITLTETYDYDSISFSYTTLNDAHFPSGISIDKETGLISGTPTEAGTYEFFIQVLNHEYITDYWQTFLIVEYKTSIDLVYAENLFTVYPNPASDELNISCQSEFAGTYSIVDFSGKVIAANQAVTKIVDISDLTKGIYFISFNDEKTFETIKFLKE
ncbi:MAG: T9SS type A sorting domain-containing protein [Bacteroidales bacterium]|nr:T9SS type A sorting domain-containing protein [Bacteroidales bacterium]